MAEVHWATHREATIREPGALAVHRSSSMHSLRALLAAGVLAALAAGAAAAQTPPGAPAEEPPVRDWFPEGVLYPPYAAEIRHPGFGTTVLGVADVGAEESGDLRFGLKLGGRFGLLRLAPRRSERLFQASLEAGFYGQFDIDHSLDNLGWDGLYGLVATSARKDGRGLAYKLGVGHISSHVGDEYAERTGRRRIGYTREEALFGVSWRPGPRWRTYAEGAWGYVLRAKAPDGEELQEPGRFEAGLEYEAPGVLGRTGRWGTYAAADVNLWEERDWRPSVAVEAGFLVPSGDRRWRLGVAWYDGQIPLGEFFQVEESYVLAGAWLDLERVGGPGR